MTLVLKPDTAFDFHFFTISRHGDLQDASDRGSRKGQNGRHLRSYRVTDSWRQIERQRQVKRSYLNRMGITLGIQVRSYIVQTSVEAWSAHIGGKEAVGHKIQLRTNRDDDLITTHFVGSYFALAAFNLWKPR